VAELATVRDSSPVSAPTSEGRKLAAATGHPAGRASNGTSGDSRN